MSRSPRFRASSERLRSGMFRFLGVSSVAGGVLSGGILGALAGGSSEMIIAAVVGGLGVGIGTLFFRGGSKARKAAQRRERAAIESAILDLAAQHGGSLLATECAKDLGLSIKDADAILSSLVDGSRVCLEVDDNGVLHYEFRELPRNSRPQLRVESPSAAPARVAPETTEATKKDPARFHVSADGVTRDDGDEAASPKVERAQWRPGDRKP